MNAYIKSVGIYLPPTVVTNDDLQKQGIDTSDEWIRSRSGIHERRIEYNKDIKASDMGLFAAQEALKKANLKPEDVDGIIAGSMSPDAALPAMSTIIQRKLGCINAFAYDITAACAFIPFALNNAAFFIREGQAKNILVIGSEICSRILDWEDRNSCVLFGDAAGAMLVGATDEKDHGFVSAELKSRGDLNDILYMKHLGEEDSFLRMNGKAVFKLAVTEIPNITLSALEKANLSTADLDFMVPHQANIRILDSAAKRLNLSKDKIMINLQKYGNTSSASVPLALYEALEEGRINKGDLVAFTGIGAGMSWGCVLFRW